MMTTRRHTSIDELVREQFDAFERRERQLRMEERRERAGQLRLPVQVQIEMDSPLHRAA